MNTYRFLTLLLFFTSSALNFCTEVHGEFSDEITWDTIANLILQKVDYKKQFKLCKKETLCKLRWIFEQEQQLAEHPQRLSNGNICPSQFIRVNRELFFERDHIPFLVYLGFITGSLATAGTSTILTTLAGFRGIRSLITGLYHKTNSDFSTFSLKTPLKWAGISAGCFVSLYILATLDEKLEQNRQQRALQELKNNLDTMVTYINQNITPEEFNVTNKSAIDKIKYDYTHLQNLDKTFHLPPSAARFILRVIF